MPKLCIRRVNAFVDWLRSYKIVLDGQVVGRIRNGKEVELEVAPGLHDVALKIDWMGSNTLTLNLDDSEARIDLECGNRLRGKDVFLRGPARLLTPSDDYLWLRRRGDLEDGPV